MEWAVVVLGEGVRGRLLLGGKQGGSDGVPFLSAKGGL